LDFDLVRIKFESFTVGRFRSGKGINYLEKLTF